METPESQWWAVCLGTRAVFSLGRETFLFRVHWNEGWPAIDPRNMKTLTIQDGPAAKDSPREEPERDESTGRYSDWIGT